MISCLEHLYVNTQFVASYIFECILNEGNEQKRIYHDVLFIFLNAEINFEAKSVRASQSAETYILLQIFHLLFQRNFLTAAVNLITQDFAEKLDGVAWSLILRSYLEVYGVKRIEQEMRVILSPKRTQFGVKLFILQFGLFYLQSSRFSLVYAITQNSVTDTAKEGREYERHAPFLDGVESVILHVSPYCHVATDNNKGNGNGYAIPFPQT